MHVRIYFIYYNAYVHVMKRLEKKQSHSKNDDGKNNTSLVFHDFSILQKVAIRNNTSQLFHVAQTQRFSNISRQFRVFI